MKKTTLLAALAALALSIPTLRAQDTPPATPQPPGGTPQLEEQLDKLHAEAERAQEQAHQVQAQAEIAYADSVDKIESIRSAHRVPRGLVVVRSSEVDPKEQENLEMDMAVMSHLLSKALEEKLDAQPRPANVLGIDVLYGSSANQMRSLYLEGYGALFMLNVNFPLLPSPKDEAANEKTSSSSEWETAKQELYGQNRQVVRFFSASTEKYDEAKVNSLKDTLLQALKNGANIRGLKSDDSLTICVLGAPSGIQSRYRVVTRPSPATPPSADTRNAFVVSDQSSGSTRQSVLTIRAKKSDVDEFAKGKLSLEEFRSRCTIAVYAVSAQGGGSGGFGGGGFGGMGFGGSWSGMTLPVTPVPPVAPEPPGN